MSVQCITICQRGIHSLTIKNTHQSNSHTLLQQLHWLSTEYTLSFEVALHYSQTAYLHSLLYFHTAARSLSSSNINLLTVPFTHITLRARSFSVTSHKIYNSLLPALYSYNCPDTFHRHLKTHYFQQALSSASVRLSLRLRFS